MKTTVEDISSVKKKILVEIDTKNVDKKINDAYKRVGKSASIKGFRPGKIPLKILERYYGQQVMEEVTNSLIQESLPEAIQETETYPLNMPVIENETLLVKGQDYKYAAIMEVRPEFELKDYLGMEVEKEKCVIEEKDIDSQIESILKSQGTLKSIEEDRKIAKDDYVIINYEGFEGDEAVTDLKADNFSLALEEGNFYPGFIDELIGEKKGSKKEFTINFEEDYINSRLAGKAISFKVEITDIKEMVLPELNEEFVKGLGLEFDNIDQLREKIKEDLTAREEKRLDNQVKSDLLEKIAESVEFELPESLIQSEIDNSMENMRQGLLRSGANFETLGLDQEKMKNDLKPAAEKNVKGALILGEITRLNDLDIDEKEIQKGFEDMAREAGYPAETVRKYYESNNLLDTFRQTLLKEKTLNYLVENASVTEVEPAENKEDD
ncbi:trigger factor [Thermodesulfobacteriota bacterium]